MKRETIEQIFADRKLEAKKGVIEVPEDEVVSVLIGQGRLSAVGGIVSFVLEKEYLRTTSKKGSVTYLDYEIVRALSFESKEVADRHAGFV